MRGAPVSHTLNIWVTASGLTVPIANPLDVLSGLTQNLITTSGQPWMEFDADDVSQSDKSAVHWDTVSYRHVYGYREQCAGVSQPDQHRRRPVLGDGEI